MLYLGQIVYDFTNERVLCFLGLDMLKGTATECKTIVTFFDCNRNVESYGDDGKVPFEYGPIKEKSVVNIGNFTKRHNFGFFGVIPIEKPEYNDMALQAIADMKARIDQFGISVESEKRSDGVVFKTAVLDTPLPIKIVRSEWQSVYRTRNNFLVAVDGEVLPEIGVVKCWKLCECSRSGEVDVNELIFIDKFKLPNP